MTATETTREPSAARLARAARDSLDLVGHLLGNVDRLIADARRDSRAAARETRRLRAALAARATGLRDSVRASPRVARILGDAARIFASYRVERTRAGYATPEVAAARLEALHRENAERLRALCADLGGGVLKLGQLLSCRRDLLPPAFVDALAELQDRAPPVDADAVTSRVQEDLGAATGELFRSFDREPLAAASLAQVHAAELPDGTPVAVKVQRPGIEEVIETDLVALRAIVPVASDALAGVLGDVDTVVAELERSLRRELDMAAEARACEAFRNAFSGDAEVSSPAVFESHCGARVLTMERVHGRRLTEFLDDCGERGDGGLRDRDELLATLVRSFCDQILEVGLFQADPHPGNFLVESGSPPRLTVLDFGSACALAPGVRRGYAALVAASLAGDRDRLAAELAGLGFRTNGDSDRALIGWAELVLEPFAPGASLADLDPADQLRRALELAREDPSIRVPEHFVLVGRVLGSLAGLLTHYRPRISMVQILGPRVARALAVPEE